MDLQCGEKVDLLYECVAKQPICIQYSLIFRKLSLAGVLGPVNALVKLNQLKPILHDHGP